MKKNTLMLAFGEKPEGEDKDLEETEAVASDDSSLDADIDLALDPEADAETRREAFRRAVKGCK